MITRYLSYFVCIQFVYQVFTKKLLQLNLIWKSTLMTMIFTSILIYQLSSPMACVNDRMNKYEHRKSELGIYHYTQIKRFWEQHSAPRKHKTAVFYRLFPDKCTLDYSSPKSVMHCSLATSLIPSFCRTTSSNNKYILYIIYDEKLIPSTDSSKVREIYDHIVEFVRKNCTSKELDLCPSVELELAFHKTPYNLSMFQSYYIPLKEAYLEGFEYFYVMGDKPPNVMERLNLSENILRNHQPQNIGAVIYDGMEYVVHRTHLDIYGVSFGWEYSHQGVTSWLNSVYKSRNYVHMMAKFRDSKDKTLSGSAPTYSPDDKMLIDKHLSNSEASRSESGRQRNVVSMTLYGDDPRYTMGAIRNAQLISKFLPGWTLRIYMEDPAGWLVLFPSVPLNVYRSLKRLGVEMVFVDWRALQSLPPNMWRFLVADDPNVDLFIVRDTDSRITSRDAVVVSDWVRSGSVFHCIRDHPNHSPYPISGGLWGARRSSFAALFRTSILNLMQGYYGDDLYMRDMQFLTEKVWPTVKDYCYCHDSFTCNTWPGSHAFPIGRHKEEHMGQVYDEHETVRETDIDIIRHAEYVAVCNPS